MFENVKIIKDSDAGPVEEHTYKYELLLPDFLAKWDVWDYWERERFESIIGNIGMNDVFFDVGTEVGWTGALIAKYTQALMVLVEPTPEFWPNIKATWEANNIKNPLACYVGLVGSIISADANRSFGTWPVCSVGELIPKLAYQYIHEHSEGVPQLSIDKFVELTGIIPTAINIDVEGAEALVLDGAYDTLREKHPLVWVSIHPDLMARDYNDKPESLHSYMKDLGYAGEHLATDHEEHWMFY